MICCVRWLPRMSVATTVIGFSPAPSVITALQLAVLPASATPPTTGIPFTVTAEIPLSPYPASEAVPCTVIVAASTVSPSIGERILKDGAVVSIGR